MKFVNTEMWGEIPASAKPCSCQEESSKTTVSPAFIFFKSGKAAVSFIFPPKKTEILAAFRIS